MGGGGPSPDLSGEPQCMLCREKPNKAGDSSDRIYIVTGPPWVLRRNGFWKEEGKQGDPLGMTPVTKGRDDGG